MAWAPLTVEDLFRASRGFERPFSSEKRCREELARMHRAKLIAREPIPDTGRGQKPFAYYLSRSAGALVPEVRDIPKSNAVFQGLGKNPWHSLAVGEFWSLFEAVAAAHPDVRILERVRDRQFVAALPEHGQLMPDGTVLAEIRGKRRVLFLELVNETSVINPGAEASKVRSLAGKLAKYKAFKDARKSHWTWQHLERVYGPIGGFQSLIVSTRGNLPYLMTAAEGSNTMFLFAELSALRSCVNILEDAVWWLPRSAWRPLGPERTYLLKH